MSVSTVDFKIMDELFEELRKKENELHADLEKFYKRRLKEKKGEISFIPVKFVVCNSWSFYVAN